jgi:hypothetical protein
MEGVEAGCTTRRSIDPFVPGFLGPPSFSATHPLPCREGRAGEGGGGGGGGKKAGITAGGEVCGQGGGWDCTVCSPLPRTSEFLCDPPTAMQRGKSG